MIIIIIIIIIIIVIIIIIIIIIIIVIGCVLATLMNSLLLLRYVSKASRSLFSATFRLGKSSVWRLKQVSSAYI